MLLIKYPNYKELFSSLFEFNVIRIQKLLHMAQNAVITAIFCFFIGVNINNFFHIKDEETILELSIYGLMQMIIIIISVYYIRKLTRFIPFVFRFTKSYDPFHKSHDGEALVGSSIAMGLLLMTTQLNMRGRINKLGKQVNDEYKKIDLDIMKI